MITLDIDPALVARVTLAESEAIQDLLGKIRSYVVRISGRTLGADIVDDLVAECSTSVAVLLASSAGRARLQAMDNVGGYFARVARSALANQRRQRQTRKLPSNVVAPNPGPDRYYESREFEAHFRGALERLGSKERLALSHYYEHGARGGALSMAIGGGASDSERRKAYRVLGRARAKFVALMKPAL